MLLSKKEQRDFQKRQDRRNTKLVTDELSKLSPGDIIRENEVDPNPILLVQEGDEPLKL